MGHQVVNWIFKNHFLIIIAYIQIMSLKGKIWFDSGMDNQQLIAEKNF